MIVGPSMVSIATTVEMSYHPHKNYNHIGRNYYSSVIITLVSIYF